MADTNTSPLSGLCEQWRNLLEAASKHQWEEFGQYAEECHSFFNGDHNLMWKDEYANSEQGYLNQNGGIRMPTFRVQINKISDAVDLFGPALMHRYPQAMVSPIYPIEVSPESLGLDMNNPQDQQYFAQMQQRRAGKISVRETIARVSEGYLSWAQVAAHKKDHARCIITDAIVSGIGCGYTEIYTPRGQGISFPRTRYIDSRLFLKDPDASTHDEVQWIAIECIAPVNMVEREYGLKPGSLKGNYQSAESQASNIGRLDRKNLKKTSKSWDLIRYWKIFSKNGFGSRLKTANKIQEDVRNLIETFGDFCYLVVAENTPYPLNLPPDLMMNGDIQQIYDAVAWPTPFHEDSGSGKDWPITELYFKEDPRSKWPPSIFKHLIGEMRFVNWCMSFLADKVAASGTEYIGVLKSAAENIREQLSKQRGAYQFIEIDSTMGRKIDEVVSMLDKPQFDVNIWKMVTEVIGEIERGSGVTALMYGQTTRSMRSAEEARVLGENATIRPDDMADKADDWYALTLQKEWQAAVWHLNGEDIAPVLGQDVATVFENTIVTQPFVSVARDYSYTIAADSARKPDRATRKVALEAFGQVAMPMMLQTAQQGVMGPYNAWVQEFAKAIKLTDYEKFMVTDEVIRAAMAQREQEAAQARAMEQQQQQQGPSPEFVQAESQAKLAMQQQVAAIKLQTEQARAQLKAQSDQMTNQLQVEGDQARMAIDLQKHGSMSALQIATAQRLAAQKLAESAAQARISMAEKALLPPKPAKSSGKSS